MTSCKSRITVTGKFSSGLTFEEVFLSAYDTELWLNGHSTKIKELKISDTEKLIKDWGGILSDFINIVKLDVKETNINSTFEIVFGVSESDYPESLQCIICKSCDIVKLSRIFKNFSTTIKITSKE